MLYTKHKQLPGWAAWFWRHWRQQRMNEKWRRMVCMYGWNV